MTKPVAQGEQTGGGRSLRLEPITAGLVPAVERFHRRLHERGGPPYRFGTRVAPENETFGHRLETWLVVEGEEVRGGVMLQRLEVESREGRRKALNIQLPLSEGTIDRKYANVAPWMIKRVLRIEPLVYAVGMGGTEQPLPRLLNAMQWKVVPVPFFFSIHRPNRVLRGLPALTGSAARRIASSLLRLTGAAWVGIRLAAAIFARLSAKRLVLEVPESAQIARWENWASEFWNLVRLENSLASVRDQEALCKLYPDGEDRVSRHRVTRGGATVGWFVLSHKHMRDNAHFANLHVGTILDAQALPGYASAVLRSAHAVLDAMQVDISVANFTHIQWQEACRSAGYFPGPSNYAFAASPALVKAAGGALDRIHISRGDGDGRLHL